MNHLKRFPHFKQYNASDCGPTSLRMVAKFYGMDYSTEMLRKHCHISRRGVSITYCGDWHATLTIGMSVIVQLKPPKEFVEKMQIGFARNLIINNQ